MRKCIFFNDTATTEIYTLSLHDALPIFTPLVSRNSSSRAPPAPFQQACASHEPRSPAGGGLRVARSRRPGGSHRDRKSTRLNSSHANISYAVFCLKKKILSASHPHLFPT